MVPHVLVLAANRTLFSQLQPRLQGRSPALACHSLEQLSVMMNEQPVAAVVAHVNDQLAAGLSEPLFLAGLVERTAESRLIGVIDTQCSARLRKWSHKMLDVVLEEPLDPDLLVQAILREQPTANAPTHRAPARKELRGRTCSLVSFTPSLFQTIDELELAARHRVTILLDGESGAGKTYVARLIHELSANQEHRFCPLACSAFSPEQLEVEWFGSHAARAHGGEHASRGEVEREGKFSSVGEGTLLLKEIDSLSLEQQAKLLNVLETGEFEPVGSSEPQRCRARLIVATNQPLEPLVRSGEFRADLFYRLNMLYFHLPPLRERRDDIEFLASYFAETHGRDHGIAIQELRSDFLQTLRQYAWPGNIRELEIVVHRAVLYSREGVLQAHDLPASLREAARLGTSLPLVVGGASGNHHGGGLASSHGAARSDAWNPATRIHRTFHGVSRPGPHFELPERPTFDVFAGEAETNPAERDSLVSQVDLMERQIIEEALRRHNHRRKETAAELGISRVTLYNKMKKFGLL